MPAGTSRKLPRYNIFSFKAGTTGVVIEIFVMQYVLRGSAFDLSYCIIGVGILVYYQLYMHSKEQQQISIPVPVLVIQGRPPGADISKEAN